MPWRSVAGMDSESSQQHQSIHEFIVKVVGITAEIHCGMTNVGVAVTCWEEADGSRGSVEMFSQWIYDKQIKDVRGKDVGLSKYQGKVLIVVNVASQCGLTHSNYTDLNELYEKYKDKGLEILAFPCNQFAGQEPGTNEEIEHMSCTRFKVEFPLFGKVNVNGPQTAPVYQFLKSSKGGILGDAIKWNFTKFLVDQEGRVVDRYAPTTSPLSIESDIQKLLAIP